MDDIPLPKHIEYEILQSVMVLLVTLNLNETLAAYIYLKPLDHREKIYRFYQTELQNEIIIYYIGMYGTCPAAIRNIQPVEMHSNTSHVLKMAEECFPNLGGIINVGAAFGIKGKVNLCDVIVSLEVVNYDYSCKDREYSLGEGITVSPQLTRLFTGPIQWPNDAIKKRLRDSGEQIPVVKPGVILSGPQFVDDSSIQKFVDIFAQEAVGVEMRRVDLFAVNQETAANIIIIKAVCDFGDEKNIEKYQPTAALLAADLLNECLMQPQAFETLQGLHFIFVYMHN